MTRDRVAFATSLVLFAVLSGEFSGRAMAQVKGFIRGDVNRDGQVTLADAGYLIDFRFFGGTAPPCMDSADTDDNGALDTIGIADADFLMSWLFRSPSVPALPPPFPTLGVDTTVDGLNCVTPGFDLPGRPDRRFTMDWEVPTLVSRGSREECFLVGSTGSAVGSFSIACRIPKSLAANISFDFDGTLMPTSARAALLASPTFRFAVVPAADARFRLLLAGAILAIKENGGTFQRIHFPLTEGAVTSERLLRVTFDVPTDAPQGSATLLSPAEDEDLLVAGSLVHGVKNEYGTLHLDKPGASSLTTVIPTSVIVEGEEFLRADANSDTKLDLSDPVFTINFLFLGGPAPSCFDRADSNDDGKVDISDPSFTLNFLFLGKTAPPPPGHLACGFDSTGDELPGCLEYICP